MRRLATALLLVALAGCGKDSPASLPSPTPSPTTQSPTTQSPAPSPTTASPSPTPTPSASPLTDLADGKHYVYAKSIDTAKLTIVVDVVQFLTGPQYDNDYTIKNDNPRLRTLTYRADVPIVVNTLTAEETGSSTKDTKITLAKFAAYFDDGSAQHRLYVLTLSHGVIAAIHEQYLP